MEVVISMILLQGSHSYRSNYFNGFLESGKQNKLEIQINIKNIISTNFKSFDTLSQNNEKFKLIEIPELENIEKLIIS